MVGRNFLARDLTIENAAGPSKHQAVALRVNADLSAFYRCSFAGYQDTLYTHTSRQYYRDCTVSGTIDFIFGNALSLYEVRASSPLSPLALHKHLSQVLKQA